MDILILNILIWILKFNFNFEKFTFEYQKIIWFEPEISLPN
jgi:hypothetical protein